MLGQRGGRDEVDEALAAFGLVAEGEREAQDVWIYPENWRPLEVFGAMQTQWQSGFGGASGLVYASLPVVMDLLGVPGDERADVFEALRVMEGEALRVWSEDAAARRR